MRTSSVEQTLAHATVLPAGCIEHFNVEDMTRFTVNEPRLEIKNKYSRAMKFSCFPCTEYGARTTGQGSAPTWCREAPHSDATIPRMESDGEREEAQYRIRLFPGCDGIRVVHEHGEWRAVMSTGADDAPGAPSGVGTDILVRRPTLSLLVDFFERHGGFAREDEVRPRG